MAAAMSAAQGCRAAVLRPMGVPGCSSAAARRVQRPARVVLARAVDEDAELEARLAKLKAGKRETTDAEKRAKRAASQQQAAGPKGAGPKKVEYDFSGETVYWEGGPADGDLIFNLVLGATLVWLPLTLGAIGRRIYLKYKFTDRRLSVYDTFPGRSNQTDVAYQEVAEVRTANRGFGAWGDMVVVLRNGDKVEILSLAKCDELKKYILARRDALTGGKPRAPVGGGGGGKDGMKGSIMDLDADDAAVGLGSGGAKKSKGFSS